MKDLDLLLPRVLEKAANCPEPTALRYLRDAAIELARRTRIWRVSDTFALGPDECEALAVEPGASIFEISHARFGASLGEGLDLAPVTVDWLDAHEPGWRDRSGDPLWLTQSAPDTVRIVPKPENGGSLTLQLVLVPSQDAEQLPDILVDVYPGVVADGALAKILALPVEFGNPQLAAAHMALFEAAIGRWGAQVPRGQQRARRRVKSSFL